jgi:dihydroorotate dehydrogenase
MEQTEGLRGLRFAAKLPPIKTAEYVHACYAEGVPNFHLCNTIPTARGGVSGAALKPLSLAAVEEARAAYGQTIRIIGGGGVTSVQDAQDYLDAGADDVAVGSVLFNPLRWGLVPKLIEVLNAAT